MREEIRNQISFTPKETDIYKIHQSGDLANLDGLDDTSLQHLPALLKLRDALYSPAFRKFISTVAQSGPLSGTKTDMAINVYTPGCHLLCHDDVIGTRRVSYILYLTDPDRPWKAKWGGALRLYPTHTERREDGTEVKIPDPKYSLVIPPAFNQLSFFTVQPGESFHDVEEVYFSKSDTPEDDGGRVRMAISGWFHIPQPGEEGFEEGLEERLAESSSLAQLQGNAVELDLPQPAWTALNASEETVEGEDEEELSEENCEFLVKYLKADYLVPDTVEQLNAMFVDDSSLRIGQFLCPAFETRLRAWIEERDAQEPEQDPSDGYFQVSRPPHKHRYLYRQPSKTGDENDGPLDELVNQVFPSRHFRKWLSLVTGFSTTDLNSLIRRFRRGLDYTLATQYEEEEPQLELCLSVSPWNGWIEGEDEDEMEVERNGDGSGKAADTSKSQVTDKNANKPESYGGYQMYLAGDDDDEEPAAEEGSTSMTGAGQRKSRQDPAIYRSKEDDDGVLFSMPAVWNQLSIVLRDQGTMRFVKYVSQAAGGDRWDVCAEYKVLDDDAE